MLAALTRTRNNGAAPRMLDAEQYCSDSDSDDPTQRDALEAGATVDIVVPIEHNYYLSVNKPLTRKTVSAGSVHISLIWERAGGQ